jgi:hypothetical protein
MKYLLLIYGAEESYAKKSEAEIEAEMAEHESLSTRFASRIVGGEALQPTHTATTVRVRDGKVLTTDGPFAETREQLGGFYLVEADTLDHALEVAAAIPDAREGSVEVRPVLVIEAPPG